MLPASPSLSISLVDEILRPNLKSVVTSNSVGNTDNCNTFVVNIVIIIITADSVILNANKISNISGGRGIIIIRTIPNTPKATNTSVFFFKLILLFTSNLIPSFII